MIEKIMSQNNVLAMIIKSDYKGEGVCFLTPNEYSQQLAYMSHPSGKKIDAHIHNEVHRSIQITQEVLIIKKGKLRVDFYDKEKIYLESRILEQGDIILLVSGGHGFEALDDIEMVEIKQGPYAGDEDKTRFNSVDESNIKLITHKYLK